MLQKDNAAPYPPSSSTIVGLQEDFSFKIGAGCKTVPMEMMATSGGYNIILDDYSIIALLNLIQVKDWTMFQSIVLSSPSCFKALSSSVENCPEFNGMTLLHAVVRGNAPLDLVTEMMEICPKMTTARDCLGRTALHVAAGCRVSPALIKAVARVNPAACDATDEDGNTPLHFACDSSCVLFQRPLSPQEQEPPDHDAICALLSESIRAATIECNEEMTPVEHAIMSGASIKTVKLLQSAASKYLQLQKKQACGQSHVVNLIRDQNQSKRRRLEILQVEDEDATFSISDTDRKEVGYYCSC
jgi:hypothetical protein